mgnify:CR=1 FL=1
MARRKPEMTTDKLVEAAKLLSQTLGEEEAKRFAYENIKQLYPELTFPDISSNGTVESHESVQISDVNPVDTYIMKRLVDADGESVSIQQFYDGIKVHRQIKGQSLNYISDRLKALEEKGYIAFKDGWNARFIG